VARSPPFHLETRQKLGFLGFKFGSGKNAGVLQFTQLAKHVQWVGASGVIATGAGALRPASID